MNCTSVVVVVVTSVLSSGVIAAVVSALMQGHQSRKRLLWETRVKAYRGLTARLLVWDPQLPLPAELLRDPQTHEPATLEAYLSEVAEGMLVASDDVARLLWHLSATAARLDSVNRRALEWIRGLSQCDLTEMRTHPDAVTRTEIWSEASELRAKLLRLKVHLVNATRKELGATKDDTFTGIDDNPPQQDDSGARRGHD